MRVRIESDTALSTNLASGLASEVAAVPGCAAGRGGALCTYRIGATKYSRDGRLVVHRSDDGVCWSEPVLLLDAPAMTPIQSVHAGLACCLDGDRKFLILAQTVEARDEATGVFTEGSDRLNHRFWALTSEDAGRSWSPPRSVPLRSPLSPTFLSARPMSLGDGKVIVPMEAAGQKKNQVILIGHGDEKLFAGIDARLIAGDPSGVKSFGDPHLVRLADGRIVALLWTWDTASERTLPVHRIESRDNGATWSNPEPTDLLAQVPAPLVIGDTLLCAVNVRSAAHGIRLVASLDGGHTWNTSTATQMWDPYKQSATGVVTPIEPDSAASKVWAALEGFTFGIPELAPLGQDAALLSYYATINGILHARACRFTVRRT